MLATQEVMLPCFQSSNDGEQFPVVDLVISLGWVQRLGYESARMHLAIRIFLQKYASSREER